MPALLQQVDSSNWLKIGFNYKKRKHDLEQVPRRIFLIYNISPCIMIMLWRWIVVNIADSRNPRCPINAQNLLVRREDFTFLRWKDDISVPLISLKKDEEISSACSVSILEAHKMLFSAFQTSLETPRRISIPKFRNWN
jgi:hypothetical protein